MGDTTKPIEIFKPGRRTAMSGTTLNFGEADLQASAAAYDPAIHEAPLVVGHPKDNHPAYGWVKGLQFAEGSLQAQPHQVNEDFAELVRKGAFKKVSASFYTPDAPANPVPGVYYLRHVGFLGAQPPAVKGLRDVSFGESDDGVVEFADWADMQNASLWQRLREFIVDQFGLEKADAVLPSYQIDALKESAMRDDTPAETSPSYAEQPPKPQQQEQTMPQNKAATAAEQEAAFAEREQALAAREAKLRRDELTKHLDGLVAAGRLPTGMRADVLAFAETLHELDTTVEFGEGDAKQQLAPLDAFKRLLDGLPKLVDFGERAAGSAEAAITGLTDKQIADRARAYKAEQDAAGNHISFAEAVDAVNAGLTTPRSNKD